MEKHIFDKIVEDNRELISHIQKTAHNIHASVNQYYDTSHPYSVHLDSVADYAKKYAYMVCERAEDVVPLLFGAYFHDSIEDARLTYNNVLKIARGMMSEEQAVMAAEIVYALTNEKGRTRAERANDRYYAGIRSTPYAPLCKFADRLANAKYSAQHNSSHNPPMHEVYAAENPHFVAMIVGDDSPADIRLSVPRAMREELDSLL